MKKAARPLRTGEIAELSGLDRNVVEKTMKELKRMYPETAFFFILGIDAFLDIPYWWHPEKFISLTNFVIISRPGFKFMELLSSPYIHIKKKYVLPRFPSGGAALNPGEIHSCLR